jgi:hypothetical protein
VADQGNLDSKTARDLEEEDAVDQWVAEIDKWIRRVDRDMGEGRADGSADWPPDSGRRPAN